MDAYPTDEWSIEIELPGGRVITHVYRPTPRQQEFHRANARYVLFGGAVGPGKTHALCQHALMRMLQWPGMPVLMLRRDLKDIKKSTEVEWRKVCPPELYSPRYGGQHNKSEHWYRLYNGSILYFGEAKDWESYKSMEVGLIAIDEISEISEEIFLNLDTRLRWKTDGACTMKSCEQYQRLHARHPRYQIVAATNPAPNWVKRRWYDPWAHNNQLPQHAFIPAATRDNPYLSPDYIASLTANHSRRWIENYLEGNWDSFENQVFEVNPAVVGFTSSPPDFVVADGGIDWGSPTARHAHRTVAVVVGRDARGTLWVVDMFSEAGPASDRVFGWIANATSRYGIRRWWADSSQSRANQLLRERGIPVMDADRSPHSVEDGIATIQRYLDRGALRIAAHLTRLWDGLTMYSYDAETGRPVRNQDDDEVDALRYAVMSVTMGVEAPPRMSFMPTRPYVAAGRQQQPVSTIMAYHRQRRREMMRRMLETTA